MVGMEGNWVDKQPQPGCQFVQNSTGIVGVTEAALVLDQVLWSTDLDD